MARTSTQLTTLVASALDAGYKGSTAPGTNVQVTGVSGNVITVQIMDEGAFVTKTLTLT